MNDVQKQAIEKLRQQQAKQDPDSTVYYAAGQLIGICEREPHCAEILCADLDNPDMDIVHAEAQIKALADETPRNHLSRSVCVAISDTRAEAVLRKFYGLPDSAPTPTDSADDDILHFEDFL